MRHALLPFAFAFLCFASSPALASPVTPGNASPVQREQAQARFARGRDLYNAKKYDQSIPEFQASMEIVASPNARLLIARAYRELGKHVLAYAEFGRTEIEARELAREDPRYAKTGEAAGKERAQLEKKVGILLVTIQNAPSGTKLSVGGDEIRPAGWSEPIPVMPGDAEIVLQVPDREPVRRTMSFTAGERQTLNLDAESSPAMAKPVAATPLPPPPAPENKPSLRPWAFVAGGVGVAGLATFAVAGLMSNATYDSLKEQCGDRPCPADKQPDVSRGQTEQTIANVGLVVGAVGIAAGVTLFVLSANEKSSTGQLRPASRTAVYLSPDSIHVRGTF